MSWGGGRWCRAGTWRWARTFLFSPCGDSTSAVGAPGARMARLSFGLRVGSLQLGRPCQGYGTRWGPRGAAFRARWRSSCLPCFGVTWRRAEWVACVSPGSCEHRWGQATLATVLTAPWAVPCSVSWEQRWSHPDSRVRGKAPRFLALLCFVARGWPALAPPAPGCSRQTQSCREGPPVCAGECRDRAGRV